MNTARGLRIRVEHIRLRAQQGEHGGNILFPNRIQRRVGYLRKALGEEIKEHARTRG